MGKHSKVIALKWTLDLQKAAGKPFGAGEVLGSCSGPRQHEQALGRRASSCSLGLCCSTPFPALAVNIYSCLAPLNPPSQLTDDLNLACEAPRCPAPGGVSSVESSPWQLIFLCLFLGFIAGTCLCVWCGVWLLQLCLILLHVFYFALSLLEV